VPRPHRFRSVEQLREITYALTQQEKISQTFLGLPHKLRIAFIAIEKDGIFDVHNRNIGLL
jgi:hypothetical protein